MFVVEKLPVCYRTPGGTIHIKQNIMWMVSSEVKALPSLALGWYFLKQKLECNACKLKVCLWHNGIEYFKPEGNIFPSPKSGTHDCYNEQENIGNSSTGPM